MLQVEIIQIDRIKTVAEQFEQAETNTEWKEADLSRNCLVALYVYTPGLTLEDAVDAVDMLDGITFFSCNRNGQAFNMVFQTEIMNWRQVRKRVTQALKPLEKQIPETEERPDPVVALDISHLELSVGSNLQAMAHGMLPAIGNLRVILAAELGFIFPLIYMQNVSTLKPNQYEFHVNGQTVAAGEVWPDEKIAIHAEDFPFGTLVTEPIYNTQARWITPEHEAAAEAANLRVFTAEALLITHLAEVVKCNAGNLLRRQQVYLLVDKLASRCKELVTEVIPSKIQIPDLHFILQSLLKSGKSIKDLERIFEAIGSCDSKQLNLVLTHIILTVYN